MLLSIEYFASDDENLTFKSINNMLHLERILPKTPIDKKL